MDPTEESVQTLLAMGFPSECEVRRALKLSKNDMNEAVDILTNGQMSDERNSPSGGSQDLAGVMDVSDTQDFPVNSLYELERRVFTDSWSIPYREDEALAKCMFASIKLLEEGRASFDDSCSRFLDRCLPESFRKLLNSQAVYKWSTDIQEGVYDMVVILIDLVAVALDLPAKGEQNYVPGILLETLTLCLNQDSEYHQKNRAMRSKMENWDQKMGEDKVISSPPRNSNNIKEFCWLSNLLNRFHYNRGFDMITDIITLPKTNIPAMASLTEPLAVCVEFLEPKIARPIFEKSVKKILQKVDQLSMDDFRDKTVGKACEVLRNVKVICSDLWPNSVKDVDDKRLDLVLKMIKCPHFNAEMIGLIEVTKMIEDATAEKNAARGAIQLGTLTTWMANKQLLGLILSGSIDHSQYCEKVKRIVEHVGPHLSKDDLEQLWRRTNDQPSHVIDNIHSIFAAAASHFTLDQFSAFTQLITTNWSAETPDMKEKHVYLLGQIGKDSKKPELPHKVIDVMWDLSHSTDISRQLLDKCLEEISAVMTENTIIKDSYNKRYFEKCVENIKTGLHRRQSVSGLIQKKMTVIKAKSEKINSNM